MNRSPTPPRLRLADLVAALLFLVLPLALAFHKISRVGYDLQSLIPVETYRVDLQMSCVGHGDSLWVRTYLPQSDGRVSVSAEKTGSDLPGHLERLVEDNRIAEWHGEDIQGSRSIRVEYTAWAQHLRYEIDPEIRVPGPSADRADPFLQATPAIEVDDPEIG